MHPPGGLVRVLVLFPLLAGCGVDHVGNVGELGRVAFTLGSDWYLEETDLSAVGIVTGHEQWIGTSLTKKGERDAGGNADELVYRMEPDDGVTIDQSRASDEDDETPNPPSLNVTVSEPGAYVLSVFDGEDEFDRIALNFDAPASIELDLYARAPWNEEFQPIEDAGPTQVREGTQLAWLAIPLAADGLRLAGDIETEMSADPIELVVPAANVSHVNEDETYDDMDVESLYFVEPGEVTVHVSDLVNEAVGSHPFVVVAD